MELNGINQSSYTGSVNNYTANKKVSESAEMAADETAVVYDKSEQVSSAKTTYKADTATIEKLKSDAENRYSQLKSLVEKLMNKQGQTYRIASIEDLVAGVKSGSLNVDQATIDQAKKDTAEDGYWGAKQTAERIVSFAKALTGGDSSKVESMRSAIEKGFKQASKVWGGELPDISQKTRDTVNKMLDDWAAEAQK